MVAEATITWFGSAASLLLIMTAVFLWFAVSRGRLSSPFYAIPPLITGIAGFAYVLLSLLALGSLPFDAAANTIRYADWILTTPLIIYYLGRMVDVRRSILGAAILLNVTMIGAGYGATVVDSQIQLGLVAISALSFVGLAFLLMRPFTNAIKDRPSQSQRLFRSLRDLTVFLWAIYPLAFVLSPEVIGVLQAIDYNFVVAVLDILTKAGFVSILLLRQYQLETFVTGESTAPTV